MITILIISIIIIFLVLIISLKVTKKAYQYKHTIDPPVEDSFEANHNKK